MTLPAPNLDDRRFQELVDDAKRLVQQRCPRWTDHNVSDPGVTLIETMAFMVEQLIYRLNRVPDRHYLKFLDLMGVSLFPPTAAKADVTFYLSAPQPETVTIPVGTEVATVRTETEEAISFTVTEPLPIVATSLGMVCSTIQEGDVRDHTAMLADGKPFYCFDQVPKPGDTLLLGLRDAVPSCLVAIHAECDIEGVGVDPRHPPLVWEAWDGSRWAPCDLEREETGGLNRAGDVWVHVPRTHTASLINRQRGGWLRCRVTEAEEGQPRYSASPKITGLSADTIGGTAVAAHAEIVENEVLGEAEGVPGQSFLLRHTPVVAADHPVTLEVSGTLSGGGWDEWVQVDSFASSTAEDRHFVLEPAEGRLLLGPAVREADGSWRQYGAVPPKGSVLRIASYRTGGGRRGNVATGALRVLKTSIPYIHAVSNRRPASGGVDGEDVENAKRRGPLLLRTRDRAVTVEDYEHLAREAAPEVARVRCIPASADDPGAVRLLVVPATHADGSGRLRFEQLVPAHETLQRIAAYLDQRRLVGARVVVEPPVYQGITVVARLRARDRFDPAKLQTAAVEALFRYFDPIAGGPEGAGWPFGRPVHVGEVYSVLQRLRGAEYVEDARLFAADPITGSRGDAVQRLEIGPAALVFSYGHQVRVERA
ncbi:MAG: putative baseplate assembly protein [Actinomycetota bacterium]